MRKLIGIAALSAGLWAVPAAAVNTEGYQIPYFGAAAGYLLTDGVRRSDDGDGYQFTIGVPLKKGSEAVEIRLFDYAYKRFDREKNFQTGLFVDYVTDFGRSGEESGAGFISAIKPFASIGVGFVEEDTFKDKHLHFGGSLGGGLLIPIPFKGWAVRLDGRIQGQLNKESCQPKGAPGACEKQVDFLVDYQVNLGLQIPLTLFFDRPVPVAPVKDCPVAVVDAETGRRDCAADSDRDGVGDPLDQCPGTAPGTVVNRQGCPRSTVSSDADGDGVANVQDKCPGTQAGFKVDGAGCVIAQTTSIAGVSFDPDSARLTAEGRSTLDGVATTLQGQSGLQVEIAGHTDSVGSDAYNTLLSQQRAEAVRSYLIEKGVDGNRLTAVGYGEAEPVASNDTEEGRISNRRVEFRISAG